MTVVMVSLTLLALFVIYTNIESWPARAAWALVVAAQLYFIPIVLLQVVSPFGVVVILAIYQQIKNKRYDAKMDEEAEERRRGGGDEEG